MAAPGIRPERDREAKLTGEATVAAAPLPQLQIGLVRNFWGGSPLPQWQISLVRNFSGGSLLPQ